MDKTEALISLNMAGDIGSVRLKKLLEYFDNSQAILKASTEKLMTVSGIGREIANRIRALKKEDLHRELKLAQKLGLKILTQDDQDYPDNLRNIYDPPIVLYVKGSLKAEDKVSLGIVGSRRASYYGLSSAEKFAGELSEYGVTIISGMARGVDTCAHKGALKAGGRTIAVVGSGFNHIYPPENKELAQDIAKNGAVVSEFPIDTKPLPHNFPRRNRVISGLSLGVLVVEAAQNSGALITADFALEQGREVFALPGKVDSDNSFGTNGLIKQGAKLVSCTEDIIEEFQGVGQQRKAIISGCSINKQSLTGAIGLLEREKTIYGVISEEPVLLDEIIERTSLNISDITGMLLALQLKKLIKQLPGKQFVRLRAGATVRCR